MATGTALGQSASTSTITYDMVQLQTKPQTVEIYQNLMTPIFFDDAIVEVLSGNPDLFSVEVNQTKTGLYMRAKQPVGMTDLYVTTSNGMTVMLVISAKPTGFTPKRIEIKLPRDAYGNVKVEGATNVGYPTVQGGVPAQSSYPQPQYQGYPYPYQGYPYPYYPYTYPYGPYTTPYSPFNPATLVPQPQPTYPVTSQGTAFGAAIYTAPSAGAQGSAAPSSAAITAAQMAAQMAMSQAAAPAAPSAPVSDQPTLTTRAQMSAGNLEVNYGLRAGATPINFRPQDLRVTSGGKAVRYRIVREGGTDARALVSGEEDQGTILVDGANAMTEIVVRWSITNGGVTQTFTRTFNPGQM